MKSAIANLQLGLIVPTRFDVSLEHFSTFRTGGHATAMCSPQTSNQLAQLVALLRCNGISYAVLGAGSNILVPDEGFDGVVIRLADHCAYFGTPDLLGFRAGAGVPAPKIAALAANAGIGGLEFLAGIPGTVGGAVAMNAGAHGREVEDVLESAVAVDSAGRVRTLRPEEFDFSYRSSRVHSAQLIIVEATLVGFEDNTSSVRVRTQELLKRRRLTQPLTKKTFGSVFQNPPGQSAGSIIESSGLKGHQIGGAQVSDKHANFMINTGAGTTMDGLKLISHVITTCRRRHGIALQPEVHVLGQGLLDEKLLDKLLS